jgi:hypothetical protein
MIELPTNSALLDDGYLNPIAMLAPSQILELWKAEFDATYQANGYFALIMHGRAWWGTGTPSRARVLEQLIRHINGHDGVLYMRGLDLAQWCLQSTAIEDARARDAWLHQRGGSA